MPLLSVVALLPFTILLVAIFVIPFTGLLYTLLSLFIRYVGMFFVGSVTVMLRVVVFIVVVVTCYTVCCVGVVVS